MRITARVHGSVQGVGFRWWVLGIAQQLKLVGSAVNLWSGEVEIVAQGDPATVRALLELIQERPSTTGRPGIVRRVEVERHEADEPRLTRFSVG